MVSLCTRRALALRGSIIARLSDDIALHVLSFLDVNVLWIMLQLNKRFLRLASEDILWYSILVDELGEINLPSYASEAPGSWRKRFWQWQRLDACAYEEQQPLTMSKAPQARFLHRAACLSGRWLYVFGGQGLHGEFDDLWVLDKERALCDDAWQHLMPHEPGPEQRQSATLTAVGQMLLMFGGRQGESRFMNDTWLFDTVTCGWRCVYGSDETWLPIQSAAASKPCPRWAHSAVPFGSRVLMFGGSAPGRCFDDLHWFDMETLRWSALPKAKKSPPERSGHCACAVGDSMYIFGGNTTKSSFNDLWEYQVPSCEWELVKTRGRSPSGRVGHTITAVGSRLLVLGGREYTTNSFDSSLHSFNIRTGVWSQVRLDTYLPNAKRPPVRTGHCTTVHAGRLLLFGGLRDDGHFLDDITAVTFLR